MSGQVLQFEEEGGHRFVVAVRARRLGQTDLFARLSSPQPAEFRSRRAGRGAVRTGGSHLDPGQDMACETASKDQAGAL